MSETAQAETVGLSKAGKITRYFVIAGLLFILSLPSALALPGWLPLPLPEVHLYIASLCGFYCLVFLLAGILGGPAAPREYFGGAALVAIAIFAFAASRDLGGMRGFAFGPGTAPRIFSYALGALGLAVAATGIATKGPAIDRFHLRGPFFVTLSVVLFAWLVRPMGLAVASFLSIVAAAGATRDAKIGETLLWAVFLTAFCAVLFKYLLGLPMELWPVGDISTVLKGLSSIR